MKMYLKSFKSFSPLQLAFIFSLFLGAQVRGHSANENKVIIPLTLNEAILKNLLQQPSIRISLYNIDIQKGIAQSSAAPFDPVINSQIFHTYSKDLLNIGNFTSQTRLDNPILNQINDINNQKHALDDEPCIASPTDLQGQNTAAQLDVARQFRNGTRIAFNMNIDQTKNPLTCPARLNIGKVSVEVNQPLLRGRRYSLERMKERADQQEVYAIQYDTLHTISQEIFNTVSLYWDVVMNKMIVQAQRETEDRLNEIVDVVKFLIQREQMAVGDLLQPLAQLSSQIINRIEAEQTYYTSQQHLQFTMGEWDENAPCPLKEFDAIDKFPETFLNPLTFPSIFCSLFPLVFQQRFDILASTTREKVYLSLLKGAKNFELPRLDIVGRASLTDFKHGSAYQPLYSSLNFDHPQKDFTVGVIFSTPFCQNEAKGLIKQRTAEWAQMQSHTQMVKQQALAEISDALKNHLSLQEEIQKANEAVKEYRHLIANERKKLISGYSTIFILLDFESSLISAIITSIQLQSQLAKNIARIRFLTGTLIQFSSSYGCGPFFITDVTTLPFHSKERLS